MTMHWNSSLPDLPQVLITGKKTEKGENDKMIYTFTVTCGLDKATALFGIYGSDGRFPGVQSLSLTEGKNDLSFSPLTQILHDSQPSLQMILRSTFFIRI